MASILSNGIVEDLVSSRYHKHLQTFIVPLTFPDLSTVATQDLTRISYGGHILELRADLLRSPNLNETSKANLIAKQLQILRKASNLPVIFTIRTVSQGGQFPDDAVDEALEMILSAIDEGCDYIDVQVSWPDTMREAIFKAKRQSRLIASFHDWTGEMKWTEDQLERYILAGSFGDILKLSLLASQMEDCHDLASFSRRFRKANTKPLIAVAMGQEGQLSRITGPISFVTHPLLPTASAPGQLSVAQVHQGLHLLGQLPKRKFFIFGNNIAHSLSPTIHNAAFAELGLPHHYSIFQTPQMEDKVQEMLAEPEFGGASVTFPHKLNIQPMLDSLSPSATKLGAVNTVVVEQSPSGRKLRGDNTDWLGILQCMQNGQNVQCETATVIGSGGAARAALFTLHNIGVQRVAVINRNISNAEKVCKEFSPLRTEIYDSLTKAPASNIIISCIPADDIIEADIPSQVFAEGPGILIEMAYRPQITPLMKVAGRLPQWTVYCGVDVLKLQAYAQFELWTGWRAPVTVIEKAIWEKMARI